MDGAVEVRSNSSEFQIVVAFFENLGIQRRGETREFERLGTIVRVNAWGAVKEQEFERLMKKAGVKRIGVAGLTVLWKQEGRNLCFTSPLVGERCRVLQGNAAVHDHINVVGTARSYSIAVARATFPGG